MFQNQKARLAAVAAGLLGGVGAASAAVPADVTTALSSMGTDAIAIATTVLVAVIGLAAFKFMKRAI